MLGSQVAASLIVLELILVESLDAFFGCPLLSGNLVGKHWKAIDFALVGPFRSRQTARCDATRFRPVAD